MKTKKRALMDESLSEAEPGTSDSSSPFSEPPDITNWFSGYVYESFPLCSLLKSESPVGEEYNETLDLASITDNNKDSNNHCESPLPSEPHDIDNWFSSYVYESLMLDTSHGLEFSVPGDSDECVKETEEDKETTYVDRNDVCPEKELVCSAKVKDFSQSQSLLSEPHDVRNWFSSYEYQSPQLSDTQEFGFSSFEKDQLIIEESDTEEENSTGIFRKTKSKQETVALGRLNSDVYKENIAEEETAKEISSENAYSDQEIEMKSSAGLFDASTKEVKQESIKHEPLFSEPKQEPIISPRVSRYSPKRKPPLKNEAPLHEMRPKHIQETVSVNSNRLNSPNAFRGDNLESIDHESDDKENVNGKMTETGFVTTKKARFREATGQGLMTKPNTGVLVRCSRSKESKNVAKEEDKDERKKKRKVLEEMSNHQFPPAEEIAGKWRCPQKNKGNIVPPLKQLRLDTWIHKV